MERTLKLLIAVCFTCMMIPYSLYGQVAEGEGERFIRVAEVGELVDSVSVWGDVNSAGRYLIPTGTTLPELISFSFGYTQQRTSGQNIDWGNTQIEVKVSRYKNNENRERLVDVAFFRYRYYDPEPVEMFEYELRNNDIVTLQVRQAPSFTDYVNVVAPVIGVIATSLLLIDNLSGN